MPGVSVVAFHFDIMCPYAFQTSLWLRAVRDAGAIEVDWRFFSLEEVNRREGGRHPWEREWSYGWSMLRIAAFLRRIDNDWCDRWYLAAGTALHIDGTKPHTPEVARHLLASIGADPLWVDEAIADPSTNDDVRNDHDAVLAHGGFGVPTLVIDGSYLFGPVLIEPPSGEAAVRLWHAVAAWSEFPHLYELQRPKTPGDLAAIATAFAPYFEARDWISIQNPTP